MTEQRADRLNTIVDIVNQGGGVGVTRAEIAKNLGVKKTPYLNDLIRQVVEAGHAYFLLDVGVYPPVYRYYPLAKSLDEPQY